MDTSFRGIRGKTIIVDEKGSDEWTDRSSGLKVVLIQVREAAKTTMNRAARRRAAKAAKA